MDKIEKINIKMEKENWVKIPFGDGVVLVNPYISLPSKVVLLKNYVDSLFDFSTIAERYINAEYGLIVGLIDLCTNINIGDKDKPIDLDGLISSGLWNEIVSHIKNYDDFRRYIREVVDMKREELALEKSVSGVFEQLFLKVGEFLNKVNSLDISEKTVQETVSKLQTVVGDLNATLRPAELPTSEKPARKKHAIK